MKKILFWTIRIVPAVIMLQTLYFKFTAAPESVAIFNTLGLEPIGRIGTGIVELIASLLLLNPTTSRFGALLGLGTMAGAIVSHLAILGIAVNHDGGALFTMALITFLCCFFILFEERNKFSIFQKN